MANVDTAYRNADARGVPSFEQLDTYIQTHLLAGAEPRLQPATRILLADSKTLAQFSVVAINNTSKKLELAVAGLTGQTLAGVLAHAATSGASNSTVYGEVWLTGNFNAGTDSPLVWDASVDTLAEKLAMTLGNPNLQFTARTAS